MRDKGLKATSCNNRIRAVNSYLHWLSGSGTKCFPACSHLRVPKIKEPSRVLPTFNPEDITKLAGWRPRGFFECRLYTLVLTLADTGCRIDEVLTLRWQDVDFDNMLLTVQGKGAKQRRVPFSFELRKLLFKFKHQHQLVFPTYQGTKMGRREVLKNAKRLCRKLDITVPERTLHAFRHTFAVNYLRRGGSVFHLQRVLGHSSLDMTRRYVNLTTDDLSSVHERISLLSK